MFETFRQFAILIGLGQYPVSHGVVGDVVPEGLRYPPEAFTPDGNYGLASFFAFLTGDGFNVIPNQAHGTLRLNCGALVQGEEVFNFVDEFSELFCRPPKTMSRSWKSEVNSMVPKLSTPVLPT